MNTSITLPLLSALPSSTTHTLTQDLLKQCWAEATIRDFLKLVVRRKRRTSKKNSTRTSGGSSSSDGDHGDMKKTNATTMDKDDMNDNPTTNTTLNPRTNPRTHIPTNTHRSVHTAKTHFLFRNLHSNNLTIRQSCIVTLIQAVEKDMDTTVQEKETFGLEDETTGGGKNETNLDGSSSTSSSSSSNPSSNGPSTNTTNATIVHWNYKLILRNVIWDLIQDDFTSFLHSAVINIGTGTGTTTTTTNIDFSEKDPIPTNHTSSPSIHESSTTSSIVQLVALFMYLLEDCEDDDHFQYSNYYVKHSNNDNPTIHNTTRIHTDIQSDSDNHIDDDGRSSLYHFIIKGGLKWISQMMEHLIELLLSLNTTNHSSLSPTTTTSSSDTVDKGVVTTNPFPFQCTSPSTLNQPRHYFHSLKQSSNGQCMLFHPMLEQEIVMRLSLLVDVFMRISLVGYLYPSSQRYHHPQQQQQQYEGECEKGKKGGNSKVSESSQPLQHPSGENENNSKNKNNHTDGDVEMDNVDNGSHHQQNEETGGIMEDAMSSMLNALQKDESSSPSATATTAIASDANNTNKNRSSRKVSSNVGTPISTIGNDKSIKNSTSCIPTSKAPFLKIKSEKERQNRRIQVLTTIRQYIWRQSNIDGEVGSSATTVKHMLGSSSNPSSELKYLSPLASLMTTAFVLSTTTPPPTPTPSGTNSSGGSRSIHSLSFLTSTLMSGMMSGGSRFRGSSGGSNSTSTNSTEKLSLISDDYPILPGPIRTERVISYLNKLTDPNQDVTVLFKSKDIEPSNHTESKKKGTKNETSLIERRKKLMALKNRKRKHRNDSTGSNNSSGLPMGLESVLVRSGKRRRLAPTNAVRNLGLSSGAGAANLSEQSEMQRDEEEMSSSTARAILRAVVIGDRAAERGALVREASNPFNFSVERSSHDSVTELMARDMMESLLERRGSNTNMSNRLEGRTSSSLRSSLDDSGFMHVDALDRASIDNENKNYEDGEVRDGNSNDGHEGNDNNEDEDIEVEDDDDEECVEDDDAHGMELVEAEDGEEEIDSDLEEQGKPIFGVQDGDDEDAMVENIVVEDGSPFEILDEDDIMLGFDQVRGLHSSDQIIANVMDTSASLATRRRNDSNASGASDVAPAATITNDKSNEWRKSAYIQAGMEILTKQHSATKSSSDNDYSHYKVQSQEILTKRSPILTPSAEQCLVQSICKIVKPPKKPLKLKVFMRRAPTQEEFFRGNISKNPILISSVKIVQGTPSNPGSQRSDSKEPRVRDLRQHIANDLQMGDSAELLELLVANKILDMDLKLRVVSQTLWRTHVTENAMLTHGEPATLRQLMSTGFESGPRSRVDGNTTPISSLPPMVVTYRLAGVDGEATEDKVEVGDLVDPEAPPDIKASALEFEKQMEKEFGLTRLATRGRGVFVLLRSIETYLSQIMKNIRRDDVGRRRRHCPEVVAKNLSREHFLKSPPCASLTLLRHCTKLADNRKKLVDAKAPTVLLRLMLEVLNSIDEMSNASSSMAVQQPDEKPKKLHRIENNPTTELLQELIETLASEISTTEKSSNEVFYNDDDAEVGDYDKSTLPMVLSSLTTTSLSPPLRKVIAKLLPFLTYGQVSQSKVLAQYFISHIDLACLGQTDELKEDNLNSKVVLMETFVDAAIHLPSVSVCNTLRSELIRQGFVSKVKKFLLKDIPSSPPPWSAALFPKASNDESKKHKENMQEKRDIWKRFYLRTGLQTGFKILIGLAKEHIETQSHIADDSMMDTVSMTFLTACHWLESTSDNSSFDISTKGLGILAETLLDTLSDNNVECEKLVKRLRKQTRDRKKEMAQERRSKALVDMSAFGRLVGAGAIDAGSNIPTRNGRNVSSVGGVFTALSNVFSSRSNQPRDSGKGIVVAGKSDTGDNVKSSESKPAWMLEMEAMEDESGLTCAVCQEGRTLQPTEMLGLYAFMKKVAIPSNKGGLKGSIDGALLLLSLPYSLPLSLRGSKVDKEWFKPAKAAALALKSTQHGAQTLSAASSSILSSRTTYFITTVTAGNAIHLSCHAKARTADRNHPKAPKSEWEGASLRNSRVSCNVILPLASQKNSKVPVMSLENALADQQVAISNLLGTQPKSMLWTLLHDVRLLLLRIAHGESLSADCGGGSLTSNCSLIYYLLFLADLFAKDAEADSPASVQHAKELTHGFLAVSSILRSSEFKDDSMTSHRMCRSFADAAPMAAICCVLYGQNVSGDTSLDMDTMNHEAAPRRSTKKAWELHKDHFVHALMRCAGRRFALGVDSSGCGSNRGSASGRTRSSSFNEWDSESSLVIRSSTSNTNLYDYASTVRPMMTLYAIIDQLSKDFDLSMEDEKVEESAEKIAYVVEQCQKADGMKTLLVASGVTLNEQEIMEEILAGINTVHTK